MKNFKWVFLVLLALTGSVFAQSWNATFNYIDDGNPGPRAPLGCPCTAGTAFGDGVSIGLFWDNDGNGPDDNDPQPAIGTGLGEVIETNTITFNGNVQGLGNGYFVAEYPIIMTQIPETNANYFLAISSGGCCLRTATFPAVVGPDDRNFTQANWSCATGSCGGTPPNAPTNVQASDDTECLDVIVSWAHDGVNVTGFTIFANDTLQASCDGSLRTLEVDWPRDRSANFRVDAFNAAGATRSTGTDVGSSYQMEFSDASRAELTGPGWRGDSILITFDIPETIAECPVKWWLTLWYGTAGPWQRYGIIARDSLSDEHWVYFPEENFSDCRLVLTDSSLNFPLAVFNDTSNVFSLTTGVDDRGVVSPSSYGLAQNFPNPFNPTTRIEFSVPVTADVQLQVFNVQGQLVRTLVNTRLSSGIHNVEWDGLSNGGSAVGTGLYFYRMVANEFIATQKMLLMK